MTKRRLKVVRLTTSLDFGGQERKYLSFTVQPDLLQHRYTFAAIGAGGHAARTIKERGFEVKLFEQNPAIRHWSNTLRLAQWLRRTRPDVVHTAAAEANFHGILAAKLAGVPVVIGEEIGIPTHRPRTRLVFRAVYSQADAVVCVSEAVRATLVGMREIPLKKGVIVYNPADLPTRTSPPRPATDTFTIVTVGRLEPIKNQQLLLRAAEKLGDRVRVILVGDGSEKARLLTLAQDLGIGAVTQFVGFSDEPWRYLEQADLFVLPSHSEGFGIAAVEAMLAGLPCICSRVGGVPEFIEHGTTGWLFEPSSLDELTDLTRRVLEMSPQKRKTVGDAARAAVLQRFTPARYVEQLEQLYSELAT